MIRLDLAGKVALVTGASQGIGACTAARLHEAGARVVVNYFPDPAGRNLANAKNLFDPLGDRAACLPADVGDPEQVRAMIADALDAFGRLDIVVNNAGILRDHTLKRMTDDEWQAVIDTNLTGVFNVCKAAEPHLADGGRIVNLSSITAYTGTFGQLNYAAAKAGVAAMARVLCRELAKRRITVNAVAPGLVDTEMIQTIPTEVREEMMQTIPLGEPARPIDIANAIAFLCSDLASYITGQTLHVNGGWYA